MTPEKALAAISALEKFGINLGLDRVRACLEALGRPHLAYPSIHVGGTNGKGSTSLLIASALSRAWASGGDSWAFGLAAGVVSIGYKEIGAFADAWIAKNLEVIVLSLSPEDYEKESAAAKAQCFELASSLSPWCKGR